MCSSFLAFVAFSNGKPGFTFPENALVRDETIRASDCEIPQQHRCGWLRFEQKLSVAVALRQREYKIERHEYDRRSNSTISTTPLILDTSLLTGLC
jgi:hypothetical protein